jgi:hypothetical protein
MQKRFFFFIIALFLTINAHDENSTLNPLYAEMVQDQFDVALKEKNYSKAATIFQNYKNEANDKNPFLPSDKKEKIIENLKKEILEKNKEIAELDNAVCKRTLPITGPLALGILTFNVIPFIGTASLWMSAVGVSQYARILWYNYQINAMIKLSDELNKS